MGLRKETRGVWMSRKYWMKIITSLLLAIILAGESQARDYNLREDEIMLGERVISEAMAEIFIERDGRVYIRSYLTSGEVAELRSEELVEVRKRGLSESKPVSNSRGVGHIVERYIQAKSLNNDMPTSVDYSDSPYLPPAGNQVDNSCVGWAVGYHLRTYQLGLEKGWNIVEEGQVVEARVFSPNFIYNQINGGRDSGSTLDDAGDLLKNIGVVTMAEFPYIPGDYRSKPSYEVIRKGYKFRIEDYHMLFSRSDEADYKVQKIREYLNTGDLPVVGVDAGYSWEHPYRDESGNYFILKDDTYIGGHAILIVAYDDELETPDGIGAFKILNSWGKTWGDDGYAYISYEAMAEDAINAVVYTDLSRFYVEDIHKPYARGYEEGRFRPNRFITRAESVEMIMRLVIENDLDGVESKFIGGSIFKDIGDSYWAKNKINLAYEREYTLGYPDGTFRPNESITRAEFASLMYKHMGKSIPEGAESLVTKYFYDSVGHWSSRRISILGSMELINGYPDGSFRPDEYITRAEAVSIINRVEERVPDRQAIDKRDKSLFEDIYRDGKKHWAYYDIVEASESHVFEYNLEDGQLVEVWKD